MSEEFYQEVVQHIDWIMLLSVERELTSREHMELDDCWDFAILV